METWEIIDRALKKLSALRSYKCIMSLVSHENGSKKQNQSYLYRSPGDIRIEQLGPWKKGAIVVMQSNRSIRAKGGGLLSFFTIDLDKDSSLLRGITGDSAVESDWITILLNTKKLQPYTVRSASKRVRSGSTTGYDLHIVVKNQPYEPYDQYRLVVREDGAVLLVERFRAGKLMHRIEWKDIKLNPPTADADFKL
jgi:hypothetical protein